MAAGFAGSCARAVSARHPTDRSNAKAAAVVVRIMAASFQHLCR
jgi:hypothetical protein